MQLIRRFCSCICGNVSSAVCYNDRFLCPIVLMVPEGSSKSDICLRKDMRKRYFLYYLRAIHGSYMEVTARTFYQGTATDDYVQITLTDEEDIPDGMQRLRTIYPNLLGL